MSERKYGLKPGEPVPEGIVRIARGRIDDALDELNGKTESTPEEAVHEARKDMKKLRAVLRLVRGEIGQRTYRRENAAFRDAARELAGVRDADVMLDTLTSLEEHHPDDVPADAAGGLRQALEAHQRQNSHRGRDDASRAAVGILDEAARRVAGWPLRRDGFEAVEEGLRRVYRQGRRGFRAAQSDPSAENLHEWRKRVKDLWYHLSILEPAWKPVMSALGDEAHELADRLGDDHDLSMLLDWAHAHATALDGMDRVHAFADVVQRRREELQAEAFDYGARLYAAKPGAFTRRVGGWWRASDGVAREAARR